MEKIGMWNMGKMRYLREMQNLETARNRGHRGPACLLLALAIAVSAAFPASAAAGWTVNEEGKWVYLDESGEPLANAVTPDGYLTDLFGVWNETEYDNLVGTYELVSDTLDGTDVSEDDTDGIIHSACVQMNQDEHVVLHQVWAYADGSVMRSSDDEYYPNANGTFNALYYPVRRGNNQRWRDISEYSNYTVMTDNGDGTLTVSAEEDAGKRITVWRKISA